MWEGEGRKGGKEGKVKRSKGGMGGWRDFAHLKIWCDAPSSKMAMRGWY